MVNNVDIMRPFFIGEESWGQLSYEDRKYCKQSAKNNLSAVILFAGLLLFFLFTKNDVGIYLSAFQSIVILFGFFILMFKTKKHIIVPLTVPVSSSFVSALFYLFYPNFIFILLLLPTTLSALLDFQNKKIGYSIFILNLIIAIICLNINGFYWQTGILEEKEEMVLVSVLMSTISIFLVQMVINFRKVENDYLLVIDSQNKLIKKEAEANFKLQKQLHLEESVKVARKLEQANLENEIQNQYSKRLLVDLKKVLDNDNPIANLKSLVTDLTLHKLRQDLNPLNQVKKEEETERFFNKLREDYPQLSKTEREIALYLKLNLATKEIASLRKTTESAIFSTKSRIKKKLGLSPDEEIYDFISKI